MSRIVIDLINIRKRGAVFSLYLEMFDLSKHRARSTNWQAQQYMVSNAHQLRLGMEN
jgi:hypothetical protein